MFEDIARLYEQTLRVPKHEVCRSACDARFKRPLLPWHIGDLYAADPRRLVIIGKPHREDEPTISRQAGTQDGRETAERLFNTRYSSFWSYTADILSRVYGSAEDGWRRIVLTTIVKCTNATKGADGGDTTSGLMKSSCIGTLGVIRKELGILRPRTIVLYTGDKYDTWVPQLNWDSEQRWRDLTMRGHRVDCGGTLLHWWEGALSDRQTTVRVLRVGHPLFKPSEAYVRLLAAWLKSVGSESAGTNEEEEILL